MMDYLAELEQIENERNVDVILAVVTGSRMWKYAGPDSDYDVRFVYRHRDPAHYTSYKVIGHGYVDTIGHKDLGTHDLDLAGWDLPKFLRHIATHNTSIVEWCLSPLDILADRPRTDRPRNNYLKQEVTNHIAKFTKPSALLRAYRGMVLSKKCSGVESVKRTICTARLLMTIAIMENDNTIPNSFAFPDLIEKVPWPTEDVAMMRRLLSSKILMGSAAKTEKPDDDIASMLIRRTNDVRDVNHDRVTLNRTERVAAEEAQSLDKLWLRFGP